MRAATGERLSAVGSATPILTRSASKGRFVRHAETLARASGYRSYPHVGRQFLRRLPHFADRIRKQSALDVSTILVKLMDHPRPTYRKPTCRKPTADHAPSVSPTF